MTGLLLALLCACAAGIGARDQTAVARLAGAQGARPTVLIIGFAMACATAALAAWCAWSLAPILPAGGRMAAIWLAVAIAGAEMLTMAPSPAPKEPTQSLSALTIVLAVHQLTDAARLLVFAVALLAADPVPAGIGGAVGGAMTLCAAWLAPGFFGGPRMSPIMRRWRQLAGAMLVLIAAVQLLRL